MMAAFDEAFEFCIMSKAMEGGLVLSTLKHDSGGQTWAGVSRVNFPNWEGWKLIDAGDRSSPLLKSLTKDFYFSLFWKRMELEQLPPRVGVLAFDFGINSGRTIAIKKLQRIIMVPEDGVIGPKTAIASRSVDAVKLAGRYLSTRLDFLNDLDAWQYFGRGWSQRVVNLLNFAMQ